MFVGGRNVTIILYYRLLNGWYSGSARTGEGQDVTTKRFIDPNTCFKKGLKHHYDCSHIENLEPATCTECPEQFNDWLDLSDHLINCGL